MEQHIIPFNQGIHLTPSAAEDGQLLDCINLVPKDGSLHNAPQLKQITGISFAEGHTLEFVHIPNTGNTNYITSTKTTVSEHTTVSLWLQPVAQEDTAILTLDQDVTIAQITSVGNTIIVLASDGMHYLLWKNGEYKDLGKQMPEPKMEFQLISVTDVTSRKKDIAPDFDPLTFHHTNESTSTHAYNIIDIKDEYQKPFNDSIYGEVNRLLNEEVTEKGYFANPFYVRFAYRLYDGSLVMHSAPIYMDKDFGITTVSDSENGSLIETEYDYYLNSVGNDLNIHIVHKIGDETTGDDPELDQDLWWNFTVKRRKLNYRITNTLADIQKWSDIIKSVDIFISQPFYIYDQAGEIETVHHEILEDADNHKQWVYVDLPPVEHQEELINDCGQFYFVKSIAVNEMDNSTHDLDVKGYLEALTSREQMTDDYDSHDQLIPRYAFPYNQRLNIANITKELFGGFNADAFCLPSALDPDDKLRMSVTYHTPQKDISFRLDEITGISLPTIWHYYIPSQYPVTLKIVAFYDNKSHTQQVELTEHRFLNGYYAAISKNAFSDSLIAFDDLVRIYLPETSTDIDISLPNKIYTSEVNNPFFFPVSGINTVGVGEINGICAAVKALSQGQFGQFPLYVFSTDGVWALEINSEGTYSVKQPVTRDVCNNPNSITQTDTAVLYATERGLHMLQGSETRLLSLALEAYTEAFDATGITIPSDFSDITSDVLAIPTPLLQQLDTAHISYDGINHIVHVYPDLTNAESVPSTHFILNLDSMEWTRTTQPIPVAFIDGYPNATLQVNETTTADNVTTSVGKLYQYALPTFDNSPLHQGFILTRETALGAPITYKILHDLRTLKHYHSAATSEHKVRIVPLVSNDRLKWYRLGSLKAASAIWYRFAVFTNMADSDILEALALITAPRRTNKIR